MINVRIKKKVDPLSSEQVVTAVAAAEQILPLHLEQRHAMPATLVHYHGLRTAIEGLSKFL